jgi:DNA polymerase III subunit gamma/tau
MSFYRIYRPQVIDEVDNLAARRQLISLLTKNKKDLPHAYLFSGPKGVGKTTAARLIAKIFNCTDLSKTTGPCGKCEQCITIATGNNLDVLEIDAASNRGIDEMRQLRERIGFAPSKSEFTVYIIDEVHMLTNEAFNALLKTLEEPPVHAVFVLATTELAKVPATIRSRCLHIQFPRATDDEIMGTLDRIVHKEKLDIDKNALDEIIKYAEGSFRDAVKHLEQASLTGEKITLKLIRSNLSVTGSDEINEFINLLKRKDADRVMEIIIKLKTDGNDIKTFLSGCLINLEEQLVQMIKNQKGTGDNQFTKDMIRRLTKAYAEVKVSPLAILPLELAVFEYLEESGKTQIYHSVRGDEKHTEEMVTQKTADAVPDLSPIISDVPVSVNQNTSSMISLEKLIDCWKDVIEEFKQYNHSLSGILRSTRPKTVENGVVTIEAFYKFHQEKLNEMKTRDLMAQVFKKLFGEKVRVSVVLGKK